MQIKEIKHRLNGSQQVFFCDLVYAGPEGTIIRYQATEDPYKAVAWTSEGYYWPDKHYLMYKLFDEYGALRGYRFDVCKDVQLEPGQVEWTDLYLDAVVSPAGDISIEDEDEVAEAIGRGELSESDKAIINQTRRVLMEEHRRIIQDADVLRSRVIVAKLS